MYGCSAASGCFRLHWPNLGRPFVTLFRVARLPSLRASDSDRERVAERLRHATAEGRLSAEELEERLEVLFAARTYGELDPLLSDLSASRLPRVSAARWAGAVGGTLVLALLGRLALKRGDSGAAAFHIPGPGQPRFRGPLVDLHQGTGRTSPGSQSDRRRAAHGALSDHPAVSPRAVELSCCASTGTRLAVTSEQAAGGLDVDVSPDEPARSQEN